MMIKSIVTKETKHHNDYYYTLTTNARVLAISFGAVAVFGSKYTRSIKKTFPKFLSSITAHGDFIEALFSLEQARSDVANAAE